MPPDLLNSCEVRATYAVTSALDEPAIAAAASILSEEENARARRFAFPVNRRDFIAAHALVRRALSEWHPLDPREWQFTTGRGGKPELAAAQAAASGLSFNLTHTDGLVACAIARDADVGVDVEAVDRRADVMALAQRYFSPDERAYLATCAEDVVARRFIEIWTLKEAFVKTTGAGVTRALDAFSFAIDDHLAVRFDPPADEDGAAWRFGLFAPLERYRLAVALRAQTPTQFAIRLVEYCFPGDY